MDLDSIYKLVGICSGLLLILGYFMQSFSNRLKNLEEESHSYTTEPRVRQLITDQVSPLRDDIFEIRGKVDKVDSKVDKVIDLLLSNNK